MGLFNMNSVQFRCVRSGNLVSFTNENDIAGLRKHEGYIEVIPNAQTTETVQIQSQETPKQEVLIVKRGRPFKNR